MVDIELRGGVADKAFQRVVKAGRASFPRFPPRGPRRSTQSAPEVFWFGRGCRVPVSPGAWSGRRWHRISPWRRVGWLGLTPRRGLNHLRSLRICSEGLSMALLGGLRCCRVTLRIFWLWLRGQLALDPRRAHRSRSAWPRAPFRRKYAPAASGNGRRAPR